MGQLLPLCLAALLFLIGVEKSHQQDPLLIPGPDVVDNALSGNESYLELVLDYPFSYFERQYSEIYLNLDGFLSFEPLALEGFVPGLDADIIAPLWTDIDMYTTGNISYEQAVSGPLLEQATEEMNKVLPGFNASWVLVCTWTNMEFETDTGEVTFQVVLITGDEGHSFIMMNYGSIPDGPEPWMAGYQTLDHIHDFNIQMTNSSDLSTSTNIGIPGRWVFRVDNETNELPDQFLPVLPFAVRNAVTVDGQSVQIQLDKPFTYFDKQYSALYLSMDGFLSFEYLYYDDVYSYDTSLNKDMISPLRTDINTHTRGDISYEQATSGPLLELATQEINRMFPNINFSGSWVFVATWEKVEFDPDLGEVTFQVILITDDDASFVLMNYGPMPDNPQSWVAGYETEGNTHGFKIRSPSTSSLSGTTNVGIPGRWAFRVNIPQSLFPGPFAVHNAVISDGDSVLVQLVKPFTYFGKQYSELYLSMDGFLSFEYVIYDDVYSYDTSLNKDMISPLRTDIDTHTRGDISYEQATSGPLLELATQEINQMFPNIAFSASWVFVATWEKVEFEPDVGEVTFQVVLVTSDDASFILMNYGPMPDNPQTWVAGYETEGNAYGFRISTPSTSGLFDSTNVEIPGRWAFHVDEPTRHFFPVLPFAVRNAVTVDGGSVEVQLDKPFTYFNKQYSTLFLSMDGFLSFEYLYYDDVYSYDTSLNKDMISPLRADIENYNGGDISYEQATSGPLLELATRQINRMFPKIDFSASWVFVATWEKVTFEYDVGVVTFQVVLITNDDASFVLMNYGPMPDNSQPWVAGYETEGNAYGFRISTPSTSGLFESTNVKIPGRWAFHLDEPTRHFFPVLPFAVRNAVTVDGGSVEVQLDKPFAYFNKQYSTLFLSMDGFLSFEYLYYDDVYSYDTSLNKDMISPLRADIENYNGGDISYEQATSGPLLELATRQINRMFPKIDFSGSWVFVATWEKVTFEYDVGEVTFQVVLVTNDDASFVLMNYGPMPDNSQPWVAGYETEGNTYGFRISTPSTSGLFESTNVKIPGRWAFRLDEPTRHFFPVLPFAVQNAVTVDGQSVQIQLDKPFTYFNKQYSALYLNMDGFLSFEYVLYDGYYSYDTSLNIDIISPLRTDIDIYTRGDISYEQATSGPLLELATQEINRMFPNIAFSASWVFVATWEKVEFEPDVGEVTFQVVLISNDDASFVLMNYGPMPDNPLSWVAGYETQGNSHSFRIQIPSTSALSESTNVRIPGRWAFHLDACETLDCTENEICVARTGIHGCGCAPNSHLTHDSFDATEECAGSSGSMSLSRCQLFESGFSVESLHLNDNSCKGTVENGRVMFHFDHHNCGTNVKHNDTYFTYENSVQMFSNNQQKSVVSRDSWLNITFSCVYPLVQSISMPMSIQATGSVVSKSLETTGTYQIFMAPYLDDSFTSPKTGNMEVKVNHQVYVSVDVIGFDSSEIATVLDSCWATPNKDIDNPLRWNLITNECPDPRDDTVQVLQNGQTTSSHFSFKMFTFTGLSPNVFLHCKVHLCLVEGGECAQPCVDVRGASRKRRSSDFHDTASISMSF